MTHALILTSDDLDSLATRIADEVCGRIESAIGTANQERVAGREEMAKLLGVGLATLDRSVRDGCIPSMLINSRRLFLPSEVFNALKADRAA